MTSSSKYLNVLVLSIIHEKTKVINFMFVNYWSASTCHRILHYVKSYDSSQRK